MPWAKQHSRAQYNLAISGVAHWKLREFVGRSPWTAADALVGLSSCGQLMIEDINL